MAPPPALDKATAVFHSGTQHQEDQPCHLKVLDLQICVQRCAVEYGQPCQRFCPAGVYEWGQEAGTAHAKPQRAQSEAVSSSSSACSAPPRETSPSVRRQPQASDLRINSANCLHCKACDIKDPYENILWTVPEGGGPRYQRM